MEKIETKTGTEQDIQGLQDMQDIYAGDIVELQDKLVALINQNKAVQYDECTGNYLVKYGRVEAICSERDAMGHFRTMLHSHCYLRKKERGADGSFKTTTTVVSRESLNDIFNVVGKVITFNSRLGFYNDIPEWDGKVRLATFLKDLYDCDANPNFFLLFLTAVMGKIKDPKNTYVPFFFDFVGNKGVGKSFLCPTLFGEDFVQILQPCSRAEDIYTQVYQFGSVIAIDDECKITGEKAQKKFNAWNNDDLKAFVTCTRDTFSRKGMQLETHPRAFVFVRTSNDVKISTEPDERRQIIFESKLPPLECRLFNYDRKYYDQVLAEAKAYYEENGVYKLTEEDWDSVREQQTLYINDESLQYKEISDFMEVMINRVVNNLPDNKLSQQCGKYYVTWEDYYSYCIDEKHRPSGSVISGRGFWRFLDQYRLKTGKIARGAVYRGGKKSKSKQNVAFILASEF